MGVADLQIEHEHAAITPPPATTEARGGQGNQVPAPLGNQGRGQPAIADLAHRGGDLRYRVAIYAVLDPRNGRIKISRTRQLHTRYQEIAALAPAPLEVIGCIESWPRLARGIHKALAADRAEGDWFEPTPAVRAVVTLICASRTDALEQRYLDL